MGEKEQRRTPVDIRSVALGNYWYLVRNLNDYHNNPAGDKVHVTNWPMEGVAGLPDDGQLDISKLGLTDELSMRVRVGRNLTTFPLPGAFLARPRCLALFDLPFKPLHVSVAVCAADLSNCRLYCAAVCPQHQPHTLPQAP